MKCSSDYIWFTLDVGRALYREPIEITVFKEEKTYAYYYL
jgi:hypothetical protein